MGDQIAHESDSRGKPLVTFALMAYNQERYVGDAIAAAFAQTYSPLEIVLSDDCSSDRTFEIMQRATDAYAGPHRIILNRNPLNLNIGGHVNTIAKISRGELIVLAAGDDISLPSRTQTLVHHWTALGCPSTVLYSDFEPIDIASASVALNGEAIYRGHFAIANMARGEIHVLGATTAVSGDVFSSFPPLRTDVRHEDRVLPFRALLLGGAVVLVDKKLVRYRVEGGISRGKVTSGRDFLYQHVAAVSVNTLPDAIQRLADLLVVWPRDVPLRNACNATITDHEARIELTKVRGHKIEVRLFHWLRSGARPRALLKLYLKLRFSRLFDFYYRSRYGK